MADAAELVVRIRGDASDLEATISGVSQQLEELERTQSNTNGVKGVRESTSAYQGLASQLKDTGKGIKEVGESIDTITKPIQYASTALAAGGVASAKFAIDFEDSFAGVKKTVDATPEQLAKIKQGIIDLSTTGIDGRGAIPQTATELNELAAAGGQLGISQENIVDFTEVMAQMGSATNLVGEEGAATLARFMNVMGTSQGEIRNIGSAIVDLGNNSATTESEIASMALRMGKYGSSVRMSAADVLGYSAALSSLGIEAQMGGSAIGRTWLSIEKAVANGGEGLKAFAKYSGKSAKEFKEQWNTDSSGAFNGLLKGLQSAENLTVALDDLGINNTQDIQAMMALVNGYDLVTESVNRSNTAYQENRALQEEFNAKNETTASQMKIAKQNIIEAARGIGETMLPSIKDASTTVADFAKGLSQMSDEQKRAVVNTGATVIAIGAISKVSAGAIKGVGGIVEACGKLVKGYSAVSSAASALSASGVGLSSIATVAGAALAPVAVLAGYKLISNHVTEAIENNAKLGQSYKDLYKSWQDADSQVSHLEKLKNEYEKLNTSINSGTLNPEELENAKNRINAIMQEIKETTNDDTIKLMIDTGEFDTALALAVSNAKDSADEIKDALDMTYQNKPQKAVSEGYDALQKGSAYGTDHKNQQEEMRQWLQQATEYKAQYKSITDEMNIAYKNGSSERIKAAASERQAFIDGLKDSDFTKAYEKFTGNTFKFGDMDEVIQEIQNVSSAYREISDNIESMDERAKNGRESLQAMAEVATTDAMDLNGFKDMQEVFESGGTAVENVCNQIKSTMTDWGFANQDIAAQVALFKNGFQDLQSAINNNALDAVVNDFIQQGKQLGLAETEITTKAALMKNGFSDIQQAISSGNINGVINDLGKVGSDMGMSVQQVDALAHSLGLIPQEKHIEFTESGYEVVEGAAEKLKELDTENVHVSVTADGDITVLSQATGEVENLKMDGAVSLQVNAEGNIDILDQTGEKLGEIKNDPSATVTVNTEVDSTEEEQYSPDDKDATVKFEVNHDAVDSYKPEDKKATVTYTVKVEGAVPKAKGTQNFEGGLAMVNDETGINDPRELIVDKGRAFIPQGKDVVLPLSKGAKVYTASQTKAIMSGMGIPHYATGKDNSDAFTSAKDDWTHYTKTHAVTTAQELEKWLEFQEKFKSNDKDIADIEEQIFSLTQKRTQELNNLSKSYIEKHSAINDWGDNGDTPLDAFKRIKDRNYQDLQDAIITWDEYVENVSDAGETLYDDMKNYSDSWLEHQQKYHNMSIDDYIAGIDREEQRLEEFYANDAINYQKYVEEKQSIEEKRIDAIS